MVVIEWITDPAILASLVTLTAMEIVLGIDNIVFISVIVGRLPPEQSKRARQIGLALALVGALSFADTRMKTPDQAFRGFPAVWNAVVFQLMVYKLPEPLTLIIIAALAVLSFSPVEFVHPLRVRKWRPLTIGMSAAWSILALISLAYDLNPGPIVVIAFAAVSFYFAVIGAVLQFMRDGRPA